MAVKRDLTPTDRLRARRSERGAALFIVVLVVALLTAIGVFAAHVTSLAQVASGYVRRSASALNVAEFALNSVAGDMSGKEADYDRFATRSGAAETCRMNSGLAPLLPPGSVVTCHVVDAQGASYFMPVGVKNDVQGMLGSLTRDPNVEGSFRVELTDVQQGAGITAGMGASGNALTLRKREATLTVTGSLLPIIPGGAATQCSSDRTRASENVTLRAFITYTIP